MTATDGNLTAYPSLKVIKILMTVDQFCYELILSSARQEHPAPAMKARMRGPG
jgi:hypothetical protein